MSLSTVKLMVLSAVQVSNYMEKNFFLHYTLDGSKSCTIQCISSKGEFTFDEVKLGGWFFLEFLRLFKKSTEVFELDCFIFLIGHKGIHSNTF